MKRLELTPDIHDALAAIARAEKTFSPGLDSYALIELPKIALADAVLQALATQQARRLDRLPARAVTPVVEVSIRPKRRRRA